MLTFYYCKSNYYLDIGDSYLQIFFRPQIILTINRFALLSVCGGNYLKKWVFYLGILKKNPKTLLTLIYSEYLCKAMYNVEY